MKCFPILISQTFKMLINTNNSPPPFASRRNHLGEDRAPPQNGGGAVKNRGFEGFGGGRPKWFRMVLFGLIYPMFPQCFPRCFPIYVITKNEDYYDKDSDNI